MQKQLQVYRLDLHQLYITIQNDSIYLMVALVQISGALKCSWTSELA